MLRYLVSRIAALTIATLVGISSPGLAIAHGYAHHESDHAGQDRDYHPAQSPAAANALHDGWFPSIHAANASNGHNHPPIARALSVRMDAPLFVLLPAGIEVPPDIVFAGTASLLLTAAPARTERAEASPRQPRAPPLG